MLVPSSSYRIQLRAGVTFDTVAKAAGYLADLGVDWLYLSPVFTATSGSSHGYDAVSFSEIDPDLGGRAGLESLARQAHGLGQKLLLDFVPNHMGASIENGWWRDVLEWGARSAYAGHFDVDWTAPKLLVPVLGEPYGTALEAGKLRLGLFRTRRGVGFAMSYGEVRLPLSPPSYGRVLERLDGPRGQELARSFAASDPGSVDAAAAGLAAAVMDSGFLRAIEDVCRVANDDRSFLHDLLEAQVWRVAHWRLAREGLTYRRFFEIAELIGVSVERPAVFDEVHAVLADLIRSGVIDGVRIDHVDGLADPQGYLERLKATISDDGSAPYIVVEKIVAMDEAPRRWPIDGTTGYEFIADLAQLLVDESGAPELTRAYNAFTGNTVAFADLVRSTKRNILGRNLAGELDRLRDIALRIAEADPRTRDFGPDSLRRAIVELVAALPVYRTYVTVAGVSPEDEAVIAAATLAAKATRAVEDEAAIDFLGRLLRLDLPTAELQAAALQFTTRFQQTSGPVMAKAVEDTAFYRFNRLIALNEVGGEPDRFGAPTARFHAAMERRLGEQPRGLSATATHDTKRGEDARARLYSLSEAPELWTRVMDRWGVSPAAGSDPNIEWMVLQSLLGAWPADLEPTDRNRVGRLGERMEAYLVKALREAKLLTSWASPNESYELAALAVIRGLFEDQAFLAEFIGSTQPFFLAGAMNALTQLAIKLIAPGVPDVYQGTELWDLSLVDPDNRRPVDFDLRRHLLVEALAASPETLVAEWRSGLIKMRLMREGLDLRRRLPILFRDGGYQPIGASGPRADHVVAFERTLDEHSVVAVASRLAFRLLEGVQMPLVPADRWQGTRLKLPGVRYRDVITGDTFAGECELSDVLSRFPVALLEREGRVADPSRAVL